MSDEQPKTTDPQPEAATPEAADTKPETTEAEPQAVAGVGFLVLAFTDENAGDEALKAMKEAKRQQTFYFEEAAVIKQDASGKVHYHETGDIKTGKGAVAGALIGGVLGILGGPVGVAAGAGAGAALGAAFTHGDAGFRDESLKTVGLALKPGTSAVAAITSSAFLKAVQQNVPIEDTRAVVSNLAAHISDRLGEGKSVALGLLLTEAGLAMKEVAVDENSAEVTGLAITDDAVVAGAMVATADRVDYEVVGATSEGTFAEAGAITKDGALIIDDVATEQGELIAATAIVPDETAEGETTEAEPAEAEKPAEAD